MTVDAMLAAEPYLKIASQIYDPKRYLVLTDDIRTEIQRSHVPVSTYVLRITTCLMMLGARNSWRHREYLSV